MDRPDIYQNTDILLSLSNVVAFCGLSRSRIYELIKEGAFPRQIRIAGSARWSYREIQQWIADRKADRVEGQSTHHHQPA